MKQNDQSPSEDANGKLDLLFLTDDSSASIELEPIDRKDLADRSESPLNTFFLCDGQGTVYKRVMTVYEEMNCCTVRLQMKYEPGTQAGKYKYWWQYLEIHFQTSSNMQYLEIAMDSTHETNKEPRFHFKELQQENHDMQFIDRVHYKVFKDAQILDDRNVDWQLGDKHKEFPIHARRLRLTLKFPGRKPDTSFKLKLVVQDSEDGRRIPCDPQVGNDPPQPDI